MKKIFVTDIWNIADCSHEKLDFVNVAINRDNLLFIDPTMIQLWKSDWATRANKTINSFFEEFYKAYRDDDILLKHTVLSHAKEQNATRLGYGQGDNGKGNTVQGLLKDFFPLEVLINEIKSIGVPQDLTVFVPGFGEDGLSDLLTNVIHAELSDFTLEQMAKYGIDPNAKREFYTWDTDMKNWVKKEKECFVVGKNEILLVPKQIVRKKYLFGVGQYFERVILEHVREDDDWYTIDNKPIPKREIAKQIKSDDEHWKYEYVKKYSKEHEEVLREYHKKLASYYVEMGLPMDDDVLDEILLKLENEIA